MPVRLPSDLEEEILSRVPCTSLARSRSVCKLWNSLILDYSFLWKYFSRMHSYYGGQHRFIILSHDGRISSVGIDEEQHQNMVIEEDLTLTKVHPVARPIMVYKIVHCDGLLLCVMDNQLLVWNPLLNETTWIKCGSDFHAFDDAYSLGYLNSDYKILRFRCASNSRSRPPRVEVCELASKTWKVIDTITFDWFLRVPLSILSLRGTPYWIALREDHTAFVQSFDFSKERFQPVDSLPFRYDQSNPLALESFRGDGLSVLEQCNITRKICIWVKLCLKIPSWSISMVVAIPQFPLLHGPYSRISTNYFIGKDGRLVVTFVDAVGMSINICRVMGDNEFQIIPKTDFVGVLSACNYFPGLFRLPGFSKQDTRQIRRFRRSRFNVRTEKKKKK